MSGMLTQPKLSPPLHFILHFRIDMKLSNLGLAIVGIPAPRHQTLLSHMMEKANGTGRWQIRH